MPDLKVFVSYSRTDAEWVKRVRTHLAPLLQEEEVDLWDDSKISAGEDWRAEIRAALESANAAILLVSPEFLESDFIREEELPLLLDSAQKQGKVILPIHVSPSFVESTPLGRIQSVNSPERSLSALSRAESDAILVQVARRIAELIAMSSRGRGDSRDDPRAEIRRRLRTELADTSYKWRTIRRLAIVAGVPEEEVLEILRAEEDVRLGERRKDGALLACFQ